MDPYELKFDKIAIPKFLSRLSAFLGKNKENIIYSLVKITTVLLASEYTFAVSANPVIYSSKMLARLSLCGKKSKKLGTQ